MGLGGGGLLWLRLWTSNPGLLAGCGCLLWRLSTASFLAEFFELLDALLAHLFDAVAAYLLLLIPVCFFGGVFAGLGLERCRCLDGLL